MAPTDVGYSNVRSWYVGCELTSAMLVLDVLIIYFACGSPFAAHAFLCRRKFTGFVHVLSSFAAILYWPVLVPAFIRRAVSDKKSESGSIQTQTLEPHIHNLQLQLIHKAFTALSHDEALEFREVVQRYVALSMELYRDERSVGRSELFELTEHPDPITANACLARRNRQKLEVHQTRARILFIEIVEALCFEGCPEVADLAVQLAAGIGDESAAAEIAFLTGPESSIKAVAA